MNRLRSTIGRIAMLSLWLLISGSLSLRAQNDIKGKVLDATDGLPVPRASVFINNSTYVRICDEQGAFTLEHFPPPPFELTITAIGYETMVLKVNRSPEKPLTLRLAQKAIGLGEVTVLSPEKDGWAKYGQQFLDAFIGYSDVAKECTLLNKEVLEFRYDSKTYILTVSAREPLRIRNKATGYEITYWLEDFERNFSNRRVYYRGYSLFTPMITKRDKVARLWDEQRKKAYYGSLNHFMRSLYRGNTAAEGFEVRRLVRAKGREYGRYAPIRTDTLPLSKDSLGRLLQQLWNGKNIAPDTLEARLGVLWQWAVDSSIITGLKVTDSLGPGDITARKHYAFAKYKNRLIAAYYEYGSLPPDPLKSGRVAVSGMDYKAALLQKDYDILYTGLLDPDSFVLRDKAGSPKFRFAGYLHITYTRELEEYAYIAHNRPFGPSVPENQNSIISLKDDTDLAIEPDGNYYNPYDLTTENYWSYEKLDKLLPLDYRP